MSKKNWKFLYYCLFAGIIVAADQWTKYLVVTKIPLYANVKAIEGLFHLTYVRNTGAAFSALQGMQWLFVLIFAVLTVAVVYEYFKKPMGFTAFERWCIAAIYGGGLGNMIDRVRLGYVVDMIATDFMEFPVFNVADIFITCGCIAMMVSLVFCNKHFWKEEKKA
jgi:signal peptidase II